jgi:hypothetical protein
LITLGIDISLSFVNGYKFSKNIPTDLDEKKIMSCNSKARHIIMSGLTPTFLARRSPTYKIGLGYNNNLKTVDTDKNDKKDEENS